MDYVSRESFDQLIIQGAFRPLDLDTLFDKAPPTKFGIKDKRALALKLGFCLMDFFDADLASKSIYFTYFSELGLDKESPYLAFNSLKHSATADLYRFKLGHPTFLSFAKLLLELEFGQSIDLHDFEVAIICALPLEYDAVSYLFDEFWDEQGDQYGKVKKDPNIYTTGRMGNCSVVLALLPQMGKTGAASVATSMRSSYSNVKLALLVGICGAAPRSQDREILLGDVVINKTIVQYDFGRKYPDKFIGKDTIGNNLGRPNKVIRSLLAMLETEPAQKRRHSKYDYPGTVKDKLFKSTYRHKHNTSRSCVCCCDDGYLMARDRLRAREEVEHDGGVALQTVAVHIGAVGSGDTVIKSATDRDRISKEAGVIAFEMEGAGVWDELPSVVIKGVCDYADSHKHKGWQDFAAAMAASASKAILERYMRTDQAA
ncbi:phosphorylase superfamily protein [Hirsutella rhossiliensis]|uniref:Phosphorylase superfamily domain-containing protein n=1 Tax=Hirsutella rhossiliensis TaxID=111463 RepID=A0A9P8MNI2_9HYPO|nr:phosphorylase superfamily domain-containing protein [Hirsutella rhossiliensis]KAH0959458.1 phosphorylase superfamily domain-containing protein [Hirsutella rhossiliensis]